MPFTFRDISFCRAEECRACPRQPLYAHQTVAESWLASCSTDPGGMAALRSWLPAHGFGVGAQMSDANVIRFVAHQIATGRVRVCRVVRDRIQLPQGDPAQTSGSTTATAAKAFPVADRPQQQQSTAPPSQPSSNQPASDQSFPNDVALTALAQALQNAAQSGVPFCEECMKAAAASQV